MCVTKFPDFFQFEEILQRTEHFMSTIGSPGFVLDILKKLQESFLPIISELDYDWHSGLRMHNTHTGDHVEGVLRKQKTWQVSAEKFLHDMKCKYPLYRDLLAPFHVAVAQVKFL